MSSSSSSEKIEWLIMLPDKAGSLSTRLEVRPKHLEGAKSLVEKGFFTMGGAFLNTPPQADETPDFAGSCMIAYASSKEEVLDVVTNDIYAKSGVWDLEKMQIFPFKAAFRKAL